MAVVAEGRASSLAEDTEEAGLECLRRLCSEVAEGGREYKRRGKTSLLRDS
jgi:hypothetical protein